MITAIIMASGLSTRMGENKLLLEYKGIPLIEHTFKVIKSIGFKEVVVVTQYEEVLKLSENYNFKYTHNENSKIGQSESIRLGILNSSTCEGYMFFVGDQPFVDEEDIKKLVNAFEQNKHYIIIPKFNSKTGNPVIFPYNKREELLLLKDDEKGKKIVKSSNKVKYIEVKEDTLKDIDTKEDYDKIRGK